jgi:benzoylformate decarboxylase
MGYAIVADVGLTLNALLEAAPESSRSGPEPNPPPQEIPATDPLDSSTVHSALAEVLPEDAIVVLESPSSTMALRNQLRLSQPGSYYFSAGGGLGFGLAASVGIQLAQPSRRVVCVLGEGSAQYAITAFWSAVAYDVPVTFLVLRNEEYAILKWFAEVEQVQGAPGLDLPALDVAAVAEGYGVTTHRASARDEVRDALAGALASSMPELVEVPVAPGMSLF